MGMKLELGSGNHPTPGYVHLDINPDAKDVDVVADFRTAMPLEDNSCEEVLAVNTLEHIWWYELRPVCLAAF